MRLLFLIISISLFSSIGYGQGSEIIYYDSAWRILDDTAQMKYYQVNRKKKDLYFVTYYYKSKKVYMTGTCTSITPKNSWTGMRVSYYENGNKSYSGFFENNTLIGYDTSFYENGNLKTCRLNPSVENERVKYCQHWTTGGVPALINGTGTITDFPKELKGMQVSIITDSLLEAHFAVDSHQDTVFTMTHKNAEYKGGMANFYRTIKVKYPDIAVNMNIEGTVYISFIVRKDGTTSDVTVIKGLGGGCNDAALAAFEKQKNWVPGHYKGRPVSQRMVLPIKFMLE